jgi:hypothetical protein
MASDMFSLDAMGERLRTQNNRITAHPIFEVQERKRVYGIDTDYDPKIAWMWPDEGEVSAELAVLAEAWYGDHGDEPVVEEDGRGGWVLSEGRCDQLRRVGYHEYWEYVQPFFTEAGAQRYIEENGHNHRGELRIYAGSAFRNHEWQAVRAMLMGGD